MTAAGNKVQDHYASEGIAARILAALRAAGGSEAGPITPDALAPLDHFHGRGLKATKEMVALLEPLSGERILDIGGGIGGPARWTATHFGCHVTSLDLTPEFCRAAEELNAATGLSDRVRVVEGSATDLPFEDDGFDRAYSENVAMNIDDKRRFYAEALRGASPRRGVRILPLRSRAERRARLPAALGGRAGHELFCVRPRRHGSKFSPRGSRS